MNSPMTDLLKSIPYHSFPSLIVVCDMDSEKKNVIPPVVIRENYNTAMFTLIIRTDRSVNSVHPDQTPQKAASDLSIHCLPLIQQISEHTKR